MGTIFTDDVGERGEKSRAAADLRLELERRALANPDTDATAPRTGGTPPTPSGLTKVTNPAPGTFSVKWNAVSIGDLKRYEVQFSTNTGFTDATTISTRNLTAVYDEGVPNTTYYARVRAINSKGNASGWSGAINSTTGQAASGDLATGAAINWVRRELTAFNPAQIKNFGGGDPDADYISVSLSLKGGPVLILAQAEIDYDLATADEAFVEVVDGVGVIESYPTAQTTVASSTGTMSTGGALVTIPPGTGTRTFTLRIRLSAAGGSTLTPVQLALTVLEIGREGLS